MEKSKIEKKEVKTRIKNVTRKLKEEKDPKKKEELLKLAYSVVDKAVKKKVIHKNTAARKKAQFIRLVKEK